ncbi:MAG TPA: BBE domain-containing protein [Pseudonocardiaceae bacterium]|nr:BBE domain-containing protein [Pseudonocardiaceae bacterium]
MGSPHHRRWGYVNYIEARMPDWARAYHGDDLAGLRQIALRYAPDRLFTFPSCHERLNRPHPPAA